MDLIVFSLYFIEFSVDGFRFSSSFFCNLGSVSFRFSEFFTCYILRISKNCGLKFLQHQSSLAFDSPIPILGPMSDPGGALNLHSTEMVFDDSSKRDCDVMEEHSCLLSQVINETPTDGAIVQGHVDVPPRRSFNSIIRVKN
ncbi:hypothetical protein LXL04_025670 [Taraxacum kok-saghyz]